MSEKKTFKNPSHLGVGGDFKKEASLYAVRQGSSDMEYFEADEWDVEVTFTRKVKPIPVGIVARHPSGRLYFKAVDGWFYWDTDLRGFHTFEATNQSDEYYMFNTLPLVEGTWQDLEDE